MPNIVGKTLDTQEPRHTSQLCQGRITVVSIIGTQLSDVSFSLPSARSSPNHHLISKHHPAPNERLHHPDHHAPRPPPVLPTPHPQHPRKHNESLPRQNLLLQPEACGPARGAAQLPRVDAEPGVREGQDGDEQCDGGVCVFGG